MAFWVSDGTIHCWCLAGDEAENWAALGKGLRPWLTPCGLGMDANNRPRTFLQSGGRPTHPAAPGPLPALLVVHKKHFPQFIKVFLCSIFIKIKNKISQRRLKTRKGPSLKPQGCPHTAEAPLRPLEAGSACGSEGGVQNESRLCQAEVGVPKCPRSGCRALGNPAYWGPHQPPKVCTPTSYPNPASSGCNGRACYEAQGVSPVTTSR